MSVRLIIAVYARVQVVRAHAVQYHNHHGHPERGMRTVEFSIPRNCDLTRAEKLIEGVCLRRGLCVAMKGSLSAYPGSVHWHCKQSQQKRTLELTLFPAERRIWASVREGRKAPWIDADLPRLRRAIERELRGARQS
jgi:hypothetical protein